MKIEFRTAKGQVAPIRGRSTKTNQDKLPALTSLLKAREFEQFISLRELKTLAGSHYQNPVISLYLRFNPEKLVPRGKALLRVFHSMKHRVLNERADWIASLSKSQRKQLKNDLDELEAFLKDHSSPDGVRSEIIFKSGAELNRVITLSARTRDSLTIDADPYVLPIEAVLEENDKVLFVEISWTESRFLSYQLGYCQELARIKPSVPVQPIDGDSRDGARRRLTHFEWHLKDTAKKAYDFCTGESHTALILMGDERTAHFLEKYLHQSLLEKIIGRIYSAPAGDYRPRKELIEKAVREHQIAKEERASEELRSYKPGDELTSGLRDVVEACNLFLIRKLFAADGVPGKGFLCPEHHYLSFTDEQCPLCRKNPIEVESLLDELIEMARLHGAGVTIFEQKPNLVAAYEGVAALLYARANVV